MINQSPFDTVTLMLELIKLQSKHFNVRVHCSYHYLVQI